MATAVLAWIIAIPALGLVNGLRTLTPIAVFCWFAVTGNAPVAGTWAFWTAKPVTAIVFTVLALGELIGDKLPNTPNRIAAVPLTARIVFAGLVGALAATALHKGWIVGSALAAIAAPLGAFGGYNLRRWLTSECGPHNLPDLPIALTEDALAIGVAVVAMGVITR